MLSVRLFWPRLIDWLLFRPLTLPRYLANIEKFAVTTVSFPLSHAAGVPLINQYAECDDGGIVFCFLPSPYSTATGNQRGCRAFRQRCYLDPVDYFRAGGSD